MTRNIKIAGKMIGRLDEGTNTFTKVVSKSKHLFRKLNAWGIDAAFFSEMLVPKDTKIVVLEVEETKQYTTTARAFREHGVYLHFNKSKDHRAQIFLPLVHWNEEVKKNK